jgi:thiol-disulfide isomerase/thioredoxin
MKRLSPDQWMGLGLGVMATGVLVLAYFGMREEMHALTPMSPGEPMPPVAGAFLEGGRAALPEGDTEGEVVLLDFWATWCPPCVKSMPLMERLHAEYEADGLRLIAVNTESGQGQARTARDFLQKHRIDVPVLLDDGRVQQAFKVTNLPTLYLVGRDGRIRNVWVGTTSERVLRREIEAALADPIPDAS